MVPGPCPGAQTSALTYIGLPISSGGAHGLGAMTRREALGRTLAFLRDCTETTSELVRRVVPWLQSHLPFKFSSHQWRAWTPTRTGTFKSRRTTTPV